jgi:hypothetical protein
MHTSSSTSDIYNHEGILEVIDTTHIEYRLS